MPDNPMISPEEVAILVKEGKLPLKQVLSKLTPQEKKAFIMSEFANDPEIIEVKGEGFAPAGSAAALGMLGKGMVKGLPKAPFLSGAGKAGLGRVPRGGGGIVEGAGKPISIEVNAGKQASVNPPNLERLGQKEFTEVEKRANMFGGAKMEGQAIKPNARQPISIKEEAEQLQQEIMRGKTGGHLPENAPRGARLRKPKK